MSIINDQQKRAQVRKDLQKLPHASKQDVDFILQMDKQALARGEPSLIEEPPAHQMPLQKRLNSNASNATSNSMQPNNQRPQTSNIDPAILADADRRMNGDRAYPEVTAKEYLKAARVHSYGLMASDNIRNHLKKMEAYAPTVSDDGYGNNSGGYGHKQAADDSWYPGMRVPFATADQKLKDDITEAEHTVRNMVGNLPLRQNEFDALVDLAFNVGATNLNVINSKYLNRAIKLGDYTGIANNLLYSKAKGQKSQGLVNRSKSRIDLFNQGVYGRRYE